MIGLHILQRSTRDLLRAKRNGRGATVGQVPPASVARTVKVPEAERIAALTDPVMRNLSWSR